MFITAKAFFEDNTASNTALIKQATTNLPQEFVRLYKKNVVSITPKKTGALRRSIITQVLGNKATIGWRMPYAAAQEEGGHGGATYRNYTTPGTGPHFAEKAFKATQVQMEAVLRELGLK